MKIWESKTGKFLGKTGKGWGQLAGFYLLFYTAVVGFFFIVLTLFLHTLPDPDEGQGPKKQGRHAVHKFVPGVAIDPRPTSKNALVLVHGMLGQDSHNGFNDVFNNSKVYGRADEKNCQKKKRDTPDSCCSVPIHDPDPNYGLGSCSCPHHNKKCQLGYQKTDESDSTMKSSPCIMLRINPLFGWKPEFYLEKKGESSKALPPFIRGAYDDFIKNHPTATGNTWKRLFVHCNVTRPSNSTVELEHFPRFGYSFDYFNYQRQKCHYENPVYMVQVQEIPEGAEIELTCVIMEPGREMSDVVLKQDWVVGGGVIRIRNAAHIPTSPLLTLIPLLLFSLLF